MYNLVESNQTFKLISLAGKQFSKLLCHTFLAHWGTFAPLPPHVPPWES